MKPNRTYMLLVGVGLPPGGSVASIISLKPELLTVRANCRQSQTHKTVASREHTRRFRDGNMVFYPLLDEG